jgi:hypothetical protein
MLGTFGLSPGPRKESPPLKGGCAGCPDPDRPGRQVSNLLADNKQLNQRVGMLERENGRYKAAYPPPPAEDPQ